MTKKSEAPKPETAKVEELQQQVEKLTSALQHERADAINQHRRHEEQMTSVGVAARANVVAKLLPVIDNFERALKHVPKELESSDYVRGVQGIVKQFEKTLDTMGVERIQTVGQPFDPTYHEAVQMEEGGGGTHEIVSEELQPGYKIGTHIIRHAMVKVRLQ